MKPIYAFLCGLVCCFWASTASAQCTSIIENKMVGDYQLLKTKEQAIVFRGDYSYFIQFTNGQKGIIARFVSEAGVSLEQDDEVIFSCLLSPALPRPAAAGAY